MDGGGGSVKSTEEKGAEKLMDDYLKSLDLHRKKIAKDGSCLFRAVAEQVLHCQSLHTNVRAKCVEFLKENRESYEAFIEGDFEDYLFKLQDPQQWVGEVEINALAVMYKRDFLIFQEPGKPAVNITDNNFKDKVRLCFLNGNHYDSVYPISHIKGAALCQSILYELLYDRVFRVDRSSLGLCQRSGRPADLLSDDAMNVCFSSDDSDLEDGEPLRVENGMSTMTTRHNNQRGRGRGRVLPERVRRSLNPTLFRNVEYDVWHKSKRAQQKMDYCIAAGMQFTVGDRCQVRLEGRSYSASIKEVSPNNGPVTVYLDELATRKQVPLWILRPHNDESSWSTVVRDKRLNGGGEWEERGKGRGRGKIISSSSSVSQATAPGSSGRMLKQHSWPPQATVEEQGGSKVSRKSMSSVDPPFGLTEKQRSARVEEERSVALVEIQLRDENSFPSLGGGAQSDGGRRKGGDKRRSQGTKTKSPVEDVGAPSPSAGERPKSSTPPLASTAAATSTTPSTTQCTTPPPNPSLPSAKPPAAPSANSDSNHSAKLSAQCCALAPPLPPAAALAPPLPSAAAALAPPLPPAAPPSLKPTSVPSSAALFLTPASSSSSPSLSLPTKSSASPPPSSSLLPPTFIAPIAPSPAAAQGFLPPSSCSLPRSSPPVSSLPHSPSPPSFSFSSSSSLIHQAAQVCEAPPPSAQNPPNIGAPLTTSQSFQNQTSLSQIHPLMPQNQSQISVSQTRTQTSSSQAENQIQTAIIQMQSEAQQQQRPQSLSEAASLPQTLWSSLPQVQSQVQYLPQSQSEVAQVQGSFYPPHTSQGSGPHPHLQPPHPSQVPHPSLSLSTSHPSLQNQTEAPPHPESTVHPSPHPQLQSAPPPPHPQLQSAPPPPHLSPHPPHHQSIPVAVPLSQLSQLSQLYQDPLYPGFPQGETGGVAPTPPISSSQSGDDLPQDLNILKFFFNLGIKAYSMPMCPPYLYLLPLQQAHTIQPKLPSRSPSPSPTLPHYPPTRHQEAYQPHPQYPPTSASMYDQQQAPVSEPPHPSDPHFNQAGYPFSQPQPPHRISSPSLSWQHQMPPHRNTSYQVGYPNASSTYRGTPPPLSQGYHPGQGQGHLGYPQYPPTSMGYQSSSAPPEELQVSQASMEQRQPTNGDPIPGRVPGPLESPAAANVANANNNRTVVVPGFGGANMSFPSALKKEPGDSMTRAVLLVDPPFNNTPIIKLVSKPDVKDVSMTTMNPRSSPSPYDAISKTTVSAGNNNPSRGYRGYQRPPHHHHHPLTNAYVQLGPLEPNQVGYLESLSVGCSTEDDWDEAAGFKPTTLNHRGSRKPLRGGRGRGGYDPVRGGYRRRQGGDDLNYIQFSSSHRGRGRERGY
ncbi:OTU domain-containing protein 4 [Cebidichthys violaceus]|uniref:OTU domain-containing protein 4 n=1 Tax=Cebidichthys violaceus TaxID=271503 RepID=UPI0035CC3CB5